MLGNGKNYAAALKVSRGVKNTCIGSARLSFLMVESGVMMLRPDIVQVVMTEAALYVR